LFEELSIDGCPKIDAGLAWLDLTAVEVGGHEGRVAQKLIRFRQTFRLRRRPDTIIECAQEQSGER
jgi:hypothetical protein